MENNLTKVEKDYINKVVEELGKFNIDANSVKEVKEQILEHIQESREHGEESLAELGEPTTFVKEYLEVQGINPSPSTKGDRKKSRSALIGGLFVFAVTFVICQLLLMFFLTDLYVIDVEYIDNKYVYSHKTTDHPWWNAFLTFISFATALITSVCVAIFLQRRAKKRYLKVDVNV
ncbi:DUF1129 family protein [Risungbinella massiliensis]|uniref:DUF1129 family protein n=1 Tax=Risungbinella massiliensis TaxID=1329796 RepID=UPI0005CBCA3D|nr:hypothetical protein [Risungbinella massiliensis]